MRLLLSFYYFQRLDVAAFVGDSGGAFGDLFADSGGFSAYTQGTAVSREAYAEWLRTWQHCFSAYANLDVIGDAARTWANQQWFEARGLQPLPVFHTMSPLTELDRLLDAGYPYIALGGMVPHASRPKALMRWLIQAFKRARGRAVFHGFGCTSWELIRNLPWYSVDSSSWSSGFRFGRLTLFDDRQGRFRGLQLWNRRSVYAHAGLLRTYGADPRSLLVRARDPAAVRQQRERLAGLAALAFQRAEQWVRQFHGPVTIPGTDQHVGGLRLYIVDGSRQNFELAESGLRKCGVVTRPGQLTDTASGLKLSCSNSHRQAFAEAQRGLKLYMPLDKKHTPLIPRTEEDPCTP